MLSPDGKHVAGRRVPIGEPPRRCRTGQAMRS